MLKQESRLTGIDFLRFLCAFLVVYGHVDPAWIDYVALFIDAALAVFFMISGYFYSDILNNKKLSSTVNKLLILLIKAFLIYLIWDFCFNFWQMHLPFRPDIIYQYTTERLSYILHNRQAWFSFLFFNIPPFGSDHLWYLPAMLYIYLVVSFLKRVLRLGDSIYYLIPILLVLQCLLYFHVIDGLSPLRCFLYPGIPCFLLGDFARRKNPSSLSTKALRFLLLLSLALLGLLSVLLSSFPAVKDTLGALISVSTAFVSLLLAIRDSRFFNESFVKRLAYWGRKHGSNIYIYHFMISRTLFAVVAPLSARFPIIDQIYYLLAPFVVFFLSLLLSMLLTSLHQPRHKKAASVS